MNLGCYADIGITYIGNRETVAISCKFRVLISQAPVLLLLLIQSEGWCGREIRLVFTGDIMLSRNVRKEIDSHQISPWIHLNTVFHSADLIFGNLEGAIGDSNCRRIPSIPLSQKIRLTKNLSNLVVVSVHWGSELLDWPCTDQREAARWLIRQGADLIIGHHPHVIQKPEIIEGKKPVPGQSGQQP